MTADTAMRPPITDNPWFWAYLFGTVGLVGVMLMGTKFDARQEQFDANFTRRSELLSQRSAPNQSLNSEAESPERELRYVNFTPLYVALAAGTAVAWYVLWRSHFGGLHSTPQENLP